MCSFSVAVDRKFQKGAEKQTDFFDIVCWKNSAEFVSKYFHKGQMIHIEGTAENNNYTDQNGVKQYKMRINAENVDFCGDKPQQPAQQPQQQYYNGQPPQYQQGQYVPYQGDPNQYY